jgi:5-methylthioadenosine/S-adenosylhomocysteine deaminase
MSRPTVIHARYIVPVRPAQVVLENHCVVVEGNRITGILTSDLARSRYIDADEVTLPQHVLLPGLINLHTHSSMTLLRGFADDLDLHVWLNKHIWPAENRFVSAEFVADGARLAVAEMLRAGTTCFNDMYFFPDVVAEVAVQAGIRASIGLIIIEMQTAWAKDVAEYLAKGLELLHARHNSPLVSFTFAPHAPYSVSDSTLARVAELSGEHGIPVHIHLLETAWEIQHSLQVHGIRPLQRMHGQGLLNSRLLAVHMTQLSPDDIQLLAECGVNIIHCPQSNLKLASGFCPVNDLLVAAVNVAIGTDGAAANNNLDLLAEAQTAAFLAKGVASDPRAVDAFTALEMMTINSARALNMEQQIGSIETGKLADLAALDLHAPETQPLFNVVSQLIYAASSRQFTDVWVAGRRLLEKGRLTSIEIEDVLASAESWRVKLLAGTS